MVTQKQIDAMKIDENIFELVEDTELEYLVHFAAPFTESDKYYRCFVPLRPSLPLGEELAERAQR